jgi:hypothetical protein
VLISTRGASSTIIGAIRSMNCAAPPFGSEADIAGGDSVTCGIAVECANAGRSLAVPVAIRVANPCRTKSLRLMGPIME